MTYSLNDDLDDMEPHPNELGEDAIVGLDVQPLTSQANPGATKDMVFTSSPVKRQLPEMDKEFVILSGRVSKATDLAALAQNVSSTQRMSQEQAELADQLSPGFVSDTEPLGMYTTTPTKTMAEETVVNLNARLDKEIAEMLAACEEVTDAVVKGSDLVVKDLELQCMEHMHMSATYMAKITKHLKANPGFKFSESNKTEKISSVLTYSYEFAINGMEDGPWVSNRFLKAVCNGSGIIPLSNFKEMSPTDDRSDVVIASHEVMTDVPTLSDFVDHIFGNNSIQAIRDVASMLTALKNKAEYYLKDIKDKVNNTDTPDQREEKLQSIMEYLSILNGLNTATTCANTNIHNFITVCDAVMAKLGELSMKLTNVGVEAE